MAVVQFRGPIRPLVPPADVIPKLRRDGSRGITRQTAARRPR